MIQEGEKRFIKKGSLTIEVVTPFVEPNPVVPPLEVAEESFEPEDVIKWFFNFSKDVKQIQQIRTLGELPITVYRSFREPGKELEISPNGFTFKNSRHFAGTKVQKPFASEKQYTDPIEDQTNGMVEWER